jgi:hypothetical protein
MKRILALTCFFVAFTALANDNDNDKSKTGTLITPLPFCPEKTKALPTTIVVTRAAGQGASDETIDKSLRQSGCFYVNKEDVKLRIYKMTKDVQAGTLIHYAEVSIISMGDTVFSDEMQKHRWWIAGPTEPKNGINLIKLNDGKFW